jgi:hypothetical protein
MYDPKFEKDVQRKMEELEFSPSEAVWMNVEREIGRGKKRRRVPFFWLFLAPALLLSGAGIGYFAFRPTSPAVSAKISADPLKGAGGTHPADEAAGATIPAAGTSVAKSVPKSVAKSVPKEVIPPAARRQDGGQQGGYQKVGRQRGDQGHDGGQPGQRLLGSRERTDGGQTEENSTNNNISDRSLADGSRVDGSRDVTASVARVYGAYTPGLAGLFLPAPKITAARLKTAGLKTAGPIPSPQRPWEAAFTGGIGISTFQQPFLKSSGGRFSAAPANGSQFSAIPSFAAPGAAAYKDYVSDIRPDLSFSAGILARKPLSRRWAVTVGLNLQYYSARLHIGQRVSGYTPQAASLIYSAATAPIQTYPYYSTGNEQVFTNRYYFLEIPASVQWQINHSKVMPIFWEGGASLSYLMSSDALYYNPNSGVYFKDGGVLNRTQVNLSTALMVGLPLGGLRLQVGPQIQYGLTGLLKTQTSDGQHLMYGGIRLILEPGKRKK